MVNVKILCIGDPHIQTDNIPEIDMFMNKIEELVQSSNPDLIVVLGDILHTHERLHTTALNKAYELINLLKGYTKTYILTGNHDYINNSQYLTDKHWMNGMKEWSNVCIVDTVKSLTIGDNKFMFVPYVPPGKFVDALETCNECNWKTVDCIFAHQEFAGCKMGAIISIEGDKWCDEYPPVVSGHIHQKQQIGNVYYTGSALQHAFGESEKNIIAVLSFGPDGYNKVEHNLELPRKKIVYVNMDDIDNYEVKDTPDKIKGTLTGNHDDFKALKKSEKYKELVDKGLKVVFKPEKNKVKDDVLDIKEDNFSCILDTIVNNRKDPYLLQAYDLIVNNRITKADDVMFL